VNYENRTKGVTSLVHTTAVQIPSRTACVCACVCVCVCVRARARARKALVTNCGYKVSRTSLNGFVLLQCLAINTKLSPQFNRDTTELCLRCRPLFSVRHISLFQSASKRGPGFHDLWWDWKYSCMLHVSIGQTILRH